jgi:hypothetical protein
MGKLTISMAIFNSYVKLPEGKWFKYSFNRFRALYVDFPVDLDAQW